MGKLTPQQLVAHRGYQRHYPENTLLSIERAIEVGARFIEFDVQFTKDQIPLMAHDQNLERISGQTIVLSEVTLAEITGLSASEPGRFGDKFCNVRLSGLEELVPVIKNNPHVRFFVELKEESIGVLGIERCCSILFSCLQEVVDQCCLISFNQNVAQAGREAGFELTGAVIRNWSEIDAYVKKFDPSVIFINKKRLPLDFNWRYSTELVVYEVDDIEEGVKLLGRGVDKIETFAIGEMLE